MSDNLRKTAKKIVKAKTSFYVLSLVFGFAAIILLMLSTFLTGITFWLLLPIPAMLMVWGITYLLTFGPHYSKQPSESWEAAAIEAEMIKLYRKRKEQLPPLQELSELEELELRELEELAQRPLREDDLI